MRYANQFGGDFPIRVPERTIIHYDADSYLKLSLMTCEVQSAAYAGDCVAIVDQHHPDPRTPRSERAVVNTMLCGATGGGCHLTMKIWTGTTDAATGAMALATFEINFYCSRGNGALVRHDGEAMLFHGVRQIGVPLINFYNR